MTMNIHHVKGKGSLSWPNTVMEGWKIYDLKFTGHLAKFSDLEEGFGNEFQSKMNDFNQEIAPDNFPSAADAFGDAGVMMDMPF